MPKARARRALCSVLVALATAASGALAQPADDAVRAQARWHFHRGLSLFNQGDSAGALAEFRRAHELIPNPRVSYNMGLTYAALGSPIEAVETLLPLLESSALSPEQRTHVQSVLEEQRLRIGRLNVVTNVAGAAVEIDGVAAGRAPLVQPLRLAVGRRLIAVSAPGHLPRRSAVLIAGGTLHELRLDLEPSALRVATLRSTGSPRARRRSPRR
jgi:Flp pilus assembly protein TadD